MKLWLALWILLPNASFAFTLNDDALGYPDSPLRMHLNSGCPEGVASEFDGAIEFWNGAPHSGLVIERGGDTNYTPVQVLTGAFSETIIVYCSNNFAVETGADQDQILGVGAGLDLNDDGVLELGLLILNTTTGALANFQGADGPTRELTVVHEMGHVLGLGHSSEPGAIMYFSTNGKSSVHLHQDDIDGIRHLYPQDELGGDYPLGCAAVLSNNRPKPPGSGPLFLLALPLALIFTLKKARSGSLQGPILDRQ